ncbi:MAG: hypothetical protein HC806_05870 [Anaerolineae bacterium]|nr:hypothetical protein [Anaerolineae bacterium]
MMVDIGVSLLAIRLFETEGLALFFELLLPRAVGYLLWASSLTYLETHWGSLEFSSLQGAGRKYPGAAAGLIVAQMSVAGFPLLAGFPFRMFLIDRLASANLIAAYAVVLGSLGLLVAGIRTLAVLVMLPEGQAKENSTTPKTIETIGWRLFWIGGIAFLVLMGLFPDWSGLWTGNMSMAFPMLLP